MRKPALRAEDEASEKIPLSREQYNSKERCFCIKLKSKYTYIKKLKKETEQ